MRHLRALVALQAVAGRQVVSNTRDGVDRAVRNLGNAHAGGDARALGGRARLDSHHYGVPCTGVTSVWHE